MSDNNGNIVVRLETGAEFNVKSRVEIRMFDDNGNKSLNLKLHDCSKSIGWEIPLNLRGLRKLERIKMAIELTEKQLLSNISYKEDHE